MLECLGVAKAYDELAVLRGVDLVVRPGQVLGLVGSNGAGKTTLISIACGLRRADAGTVRITGPDGRTVDVAREPHRAARLVGLAPQSLGLYPMLTVAQNLRMFGELSGLASRTARRRAIEVAEEIDLADRLAEPAENLSGGQARRLHTGMALLHRPAVLFLDEPTVGADVAARAAILDVVRRLAADGAAVVYTTHYLTELVDLGADVAVLHEGRIVTEAPVDRLLAEHAAPTVAVVTAGTAADLAGWHAERETPDGVRWVPSPGRLAGGDPTALVTAAIAQLPHGCELRAIEIAPPSLDSAFLALTGHHLETTPEAPDAVLA